MVISSWVVAILPEWWPIPTTVGTSLHIVLMKWKYRLCFCGLLCSLIKHWRYWGWVCWHQLLGRRLCEALMLALSCQTHVLHLKNRFRFRASDTNVCWNPWSYGCNVCTHVNCMCFARVCVRACASGCICVCMCMSLHVYANWQPFISFPTAAANMHSMPFHSSWLPKRNFSTFVRHRHFLHSPSLLSQGITNWVSVVSLFPVGNLISFPCSPKVVHLYVFCILTEANYIYIGWRTAPGWYRNITEHKLRMLEDRANSETDDATVQAKYLKVCYEKFRLFGQLILLPSPKLHKVLNEVRKCWR